MALVAVDTDGLYRPKTLTDARNQTTQYVYHDENSPYFGLPKSVTYPGGAQIQYTEYDGLGRLIRAMDARGRLFAAGYNRDGQVIGTSLGNISQSYIYDWRGRLAEVNGGTNNPNYFQRFAYDDTGAVSRVETTQGVTTYAYNDDGSRKAMGVQAKQRSPALAGPLFSFAYGYDALGRMTQTTNPAGETTQWGYVGSGGRVASQTLANGVTTFYSYDALGRIHHGVTQRGQQVIAAFGTSATGLNRDVWGRMQSVASQAGAYSGQQQFVYDAQGRLTGESNYTLSQSYTYDAAGNVSGSIGFAQYNNNNQPTNLFYYGDGTPYAAIGVGVLSWDDRGQLSEVRVGASSTLLTHNDYRMDGLRAVKQPGSGARTPYLYDGLAPVAESEPIAEMPHTVNTYGPMGLVSRHDVHVGVRFDLSGVHEEHGVLRAERASRHRGSPRCKRECSFERALGRVRSTGGGRPSHE